MISYRTRRFFSRLCVSILTLALVLTVGGVCGLLWLNRYVVYTQDGAKLDFGISPDYPAGELATAPATRPTVPFNYGQEVETTAPITTELQQMQGYWVELAALKADPDAVKAQIAALPKGTPVMLNLKTIRGEIYYTSNVVKHAWDVNLTKVDSLIAWAKEDYYLIACLPALRDYWYGLDHVSDGLPKKWANGALWMDEKNCYWLNPTSNGTVSYLVRTITELRTLGFDEVAFSDFRFPTTDKIDFSGDKQTALMEAAATLVNTCTTDTFAVSFLCEGTSMQIPEGRVRLYLTGVAAADAAALAAQAKAENPAAQVVFLTDSYDTRYEAFGILRPITEPLP